MVYNNLDWARAALSLERAISVGFATRYMQLAKVTGQEARGDITAVDACVARWR